MLQQRAAVARQVYESMPNLNAEFMVASVDPATV